MTQLKIKMRSILSGLLLLILILDFPWNRLFQVSETMYSLNSTVSKLIILFISFFALFITLQKYGRLIYKYHFVKRYTVMVCVVTLVIVFYSAIVYNSQSIMRSFKLGHHYFLIILAVCFLAKMEFDNGIENLMMILNVYSFCWYLITATQSILYSTNGTLFMKGIDANWVGFLGTGTLRISLIAIPNFMIVYNFCKIIEKKPKVFNYVQLILGLFCLLFVQQTRAYDVVVFVSCVMVYISYSDKPTNVLRNIIIAGVIIAVALNTPYAKALIDSFTTSEITAKTASNTARLYAYDYYWNCFLNNPLFGNGFAAPEKYRTITNGPLGMASYSDCGIIAIGAQFGIFGYIIYALYIGRMISIVWKLKRNKQLRNNTIVVGVLCYCVLSSISLINMTVAFIILYPMCLAVVEYQNCHSD